MPLNEQVAKYSQFVTDIAYIALNLWFAYNKDITVSYEDDFGQRQELQITQEDINALQPNIKIDVSSDSPWSKQAEQQEIKELFMQGHITLEEYTELMPDNSYIPKAKLKIILEKRQNQMAQQAMQQIPMAEQMPMGQATEQEELDDDEEAAAIDEMALQMMNTEELDDEEEAAAIDEGAMQIMQGKGAVDENGELTDGALDEDALVERLLAEAEAAEWQNSRSVNKELKEILDKCLEEGLIDKEDYKKALQNGLSEEEIEYLKSLLS